MTKILVHEQFNSVTHEHDIALLKLSECPLVQPVQEDGWTWWPTLLPASRARAAPMRGSRPPWQVGAPPLVLYWSPGWGATEQQGLSDTLQALEVEVVGGEECRAAMADLTIGAGMLCAGGVEGQAPCRVSGVSS